ncbi:hypothetical protein ACFXTO_031107 [Malus domestica]
MNLGWLDLGPWKMTVVCCLIQDLPPWLSSNYQTAISLARQIFVDFLTLLISNRIEGEVGFLPDFLTRRILTDFLTRLSENV